MWLLPNNDTFIVYNVKPNIDGLIEIDKLPDGNGILKMSDGELYYEPIPEISVEPVEPEVPVEPEPEPEPETNPQLQQIMEKLENQEFYNLTLMEMNMALYEEILALQDRLDNA